MNITFLGTGSAYPSPSRAASGIILQHLNNGEQWLFDCGEGTQIQIQKIKEVKFKRISRIFITHLHGDHVFGLPGLLSTMAHKETDGIIVYIYGPQGLKKMLRTVLGLSHHELTFKYCVYEIEINDDYKPDGWCPKVNPISNDPPLSYEVEGNSIDISYDMQGQPAWKLFYDSNCGATVWAIPLRHTVPCIGFVVLTDDKLGRLDIKKALELGVPKGPLLGRLKNGENVTLASGLIVSHKEVVSEPIPGTHVVIMGDSNNSESLISFMDRKDIKVGNNHPRINFLVHEATLENDYQDMCVTKGHSTPQMVAHLSNRLQVDTLILTHFSQRYFDEDCDDCEEKERISILRDQVMRNSEFSGQVLLAKDLLTIELK